MNKKKRVSFLGETLGLSPLPRRIKQAIITIRGEEDVPPTHFNLSSLKQLYVRSIPMWWGKQIVKRKVIISNLFNHRQTPIEDGWSVAKTQIEDFRGKSQTYDSHNGTDFAIPVGTTVLAPADGKVVRIVSEFNRGGLKVFIDHGNNLMTCFAHLARNLVNVGDIISCGTPIAISGYSGIDGFITFPFGIPHVHFNTWLNGEPVDPFRLPNGKSLWKENWPKPITESPKENPDFEISKYNAEKLAKAIDNCITQSSRMRISAITDFELRAVELIAESNYYPTRFRKRLSIYEKQYNGSEVLSLPFSKKDFDDIVFLDEI